RRRSCALPPSSESSDALVSRGYRAAQRYSPRRGRRRRSARLWRAGAIECRDFSARAEPDLGGPVDTARIQARAVVKVAAISLVVVAAGLLLAIIVLHIRTEI